MSSQHPTVRPVNDPVNVTSQSVVFAEDRYVFGESLGAGAMGQVFAAFDRERGIEVAVKKLLPELARSFTYVKRFGREAALCKRMLSPHVVNVLGVAVTRDNVPCIVYERLVGETLEERIAREGPLSPADSVAVITQISRALTRAHQMGIVHRDVKPGNIFLTRNADGRLHAKLIDFGIAESANEEGQLESCDLAGTPDYLSPEQLLGERRPDPQDDVYALAVVAFECVVGRVPFTGELDELVAFATDGDVPSARESRPDLRSAADAWFRRALHRRQDRRFATAKELARSFELVMCPVARPVARIAA
jgi:eukaryotic-like serine/threonine-protein kinase